jgi:hypothetical protein
LAGSRISCQWYKHSNKQFYFAIVLAALKNQDNISTQKWKKKNATKPPPNREPQPVSQTHIFYNDERLVKLYKPARRSDQVLDH